ncbi:MAG: hypothetical protein K1X94_08560 [Sandaracinaceae bacterium]|nr:hypothetical protein [Sandaracinaceae bacterium]
MTPVRPLFLTPRSFATLVTACLATLGCDGPAPMVDAGPSPLDAHESPDAPRGPDAAEPADAFVAPDAAGPRCTGAGCEIVEIALAFETSCARRGNGEVLCWGRGQSGELGDGASRHLPGCTRVGSSDRTDCSDSAVVVALPMPALRLYAQGGFDVCAEVAGGDFYCWGSRGYRITDAMMGDRLRPELTPTYQGAQSFANAFIYTCWLDASGTPSCIGDNSVGALGVGDFVQRFDPAHPVTREGTTTTPLTGLVEIATSTTFGSTTCARTADQLYCWGQNDIGQLGDPTPHTSCVAGIDVFDCTEVATPIDFADAARIRDLTLGSQHTCALLDDGTAWCWGQNRNGELGLGSPGAQDIDARRSPTLNPNLANVAELQLGARHGCARLEDGTVWCWGSNDLGQLGDGVPDHPEDQCMNGSTLIDCSSVPVQVPGIDDATALDVGRQHTCVIRAGGTVWCWGNNETFESGPGTRDPVVTPQRITSL